MLSEARGLLGAGKGMLHECSLLQTDIVAQSGCFAVVEEGGSKCNQVACMPLRIDMLWYWEHEE